jgi:hypothetical protein
MAKDEFIGIRVTKEFKKFIQREAKRKGVSLSEYIEDHTDDNFKLTRKHFETLLERAKEDLPAFWVEAEKFQITKEFEKILPLLVSDFLNPINRTEPRFHPAFMLMYVHLIIKNTIGHIDMLDDEYKRKAIGDYLSAAEVIAKNLNLLKTPDKDEQKQIISELKDVIETFAFNFTSMAFEKESFVKIKGELDKVEKTLHKDIESRIKR